MENSAFKLSNRTSEIDTSSTTINVRQTCNSGDWPHVTHVAYSFSQMGDRDVRTKKGVRLVFFHHNVPKAKIKTMNEIWEKSFWKKMKGVAVISIHQSVIFNCVSPSEVYENLLNISKFTKKKCTLTSAIEMGDEFTLYDGEIQGRCHKIIKNHLIIFKWRAVDWPEGHFGEVKLMLQELMQEYTGHSITTKVFLTHDGIPTKNIDNTHKFWNRFWKDFKDQKGEISLGVKQRESKGSTISEKIKDTGKRVTERRGT